MICWGITYFGTGFMGFSFAGGGGTGGLCRPGNLILPGGSLRKSLVSGLSPEQRGESTNTRDKYYHNWYISSDSSAFKWAQIFTEVINVVHLIKYFRCVFTT